MERKYIFVVEDEGIVALDIQKRLQALGYGVSGIASSGEDALEMIRQSHPDLVLMDIVLRGKMDGVEAAEQIRALLDIPVVYLTAYADDKILDRAKVTGPFGYILKPFETRDLPVAIEMALYKHQMEQALKESHARLDRSLKATIDVISKMIDLKGGFFREHQKRVSLLAFEIAKEMGLPEERAEGISVAGALHDIGLITLPGDVLRNLDVLKDTELTLYRSLYRSHPESGYDILKDIEFKWPIADIVLQHHEYLDGSGYPMGLNGEEILLESRIIGVAAFIEDMASSTISRPAFSVEMVLEKLVENRGIFYDPEVVDACLRLFREKGYTLEG